MPYSAQKGIMRFTQDQHKLWAALFKHQQPNVEKFASQMFLAGLEKIELSKDHIPTLAELSAKITPATGWKVLRTKTRYIDSNPWYQHFLRREFVVTNFLRSWDEFEFTHEPDMFHDIFGHLPFHMLPEYTQLIEMFAPVFLRANKQQQEDIKRLAWFSYEFGLIRENGQPKIFGTGLLSSIGEISQVAAGKTPIREFTIENVLQRNKAIFDFNQELFVFDSLDDLKTELKKYFDLILANADGVRLLDNANQKIIDQQMKL